MTSLDALGEVWAIVVGVAGGAGVVGAAIGRLTAPWSDMRRQVAQHHRILVEADTEGTSTLTRQVLDTNRRLQAHIDEHVAERAALADRDARLTAQLDTILAAVRAGGPAGA